jgi:1-aminocyclopropane-1-carboxylate deaminase/D-cysteine desulfhydrase-like pyridoxal-dependent ACC family enzyme
MKPDDNKNIDGNLLLDTIIGANIRWCDPTGYTQRAFHMANWKKELEAKGHKVMIIPEGGSNATGSQGYKNAVVELNKQLKGK